MAVINTFGLAVLHMINQKNKLRKLRENFAKPSSQGSVDAGAVKFSRRILEKQTPEVQQICRKHFRKDFPAGF